MEDIKIRVIVFFKERLFKKQIDLDTVINTIDLDKDDAIMIFEEFLMEFEIESGYSNFDIDKYFYKLNILDALLINVFRKNIANKYFKKKPITIKHMIEVAKKKEWFDPV